MPTVPHIRVELFGNLLSGAEKWSAGFSTAPEVSPTNDIMKLYAQVALADFNTHFWEAVSVKSYFPTATSFVGVKASQYNSAGQTVAVWTEVDSSPAPGTGVFALPPQNSLVVSLRTNTAGARGRGRMYLPGPAAVGLTNAGRLDTGARAAMVPALKAFFDAFNARANVFPVAVASSAGNFVTTVNTIALGDVIDTQRRRRDTLPESYLTATLA